MLTASKSAASDESEAEVRIRIHRAINRIDIAKADALDQLLSLQRNPDSTPEEFEKLAAEHPIQFHRGFRPASRLQVNEALARLRKNNDKAALTIRTGADISHEDPARLSTGSLVLDWVLNGGIPRAMITQFKGAESLGKTFCALQAAATTQAMGGHVMWIAAERFNKDWARRCGVRIPYSPTEIQRLPKEGQETALAYNKIHDEDGEKFSLVVGRNGNEVLQTIVESAELNFADLIVLDSIAVLRRALVLDKKNVGDETMGGEAKLFNDFCTRVESAFNYVESNYGREINEVYVCEACGEKINAKKEHKTCTATKKPTFKKEVDIGAPVRTSILVINQLRDRGIGSPFPQAPDSPGGRGLRHAKGVEIEFLTGEALSTTYADRAISYGKRIAFCCTKSKVGAPERTGAIEIHYETVPGVSEAGTFSLWADLFGCKMKGRLADNIMSLAEMAGILTRSGPYLYLGEYKFHGQPKFEEFLLDPANHLVIQGIKCEISKWIREGGM